MTGQLYAGFWIRFMASMIDSVLWLLLLIPVYATMSYYGYVDLGNPNEEMSWLEVWLNLMMVVIVILFWRYKSATPGKLVTELSIVDAKTGEELSTSQCIIRYLGYFISTIPLCLGFIWIGFDPRKQGWHDKIAGTVVVKKDKSLPVRFKKRDKKS